MNAWVGSMTSLITAGTNSLQTLLNALSALETIENFNFDEIYLFDTPETSSKSQDILTGIRATPKRRNLQITSFVVNENNAYKRIPEFMARHVLNDTKRIQEVVVDLTTGPKYITSLLYSAANFCQISNIYYFLLKDNDKRSVPFDALIKHKDYEHLQLPPFSGKSLMALSWRSSLDLIYYLKDIEVLIEGFPPESKELAKSVDRTMRSAVRYYFNEEYKEVLSSIGLLLEDWVAQIYATWEIQGTLKAHMPTDQKTDSRKRPKGKLGDMNYVFDDLLYIKQPGKTESFTSEELQSFIPLTMVGDMLNIARNYRNIVVHPHCYQYDRNDAKIALDIGFACVNRCMQAGLLPKIRPIP